MKRALSPDRLNKINRIHELALRYYNGDKAKMKLWMSIPNPALPGGFSPSQLCKMGQHAKLLNMLEKAMEGYKP